MKKLYYFEGRNTPVVARSAEEARQKKKRGGERIVAIRTPSKSDHRDIAAGRWVRTRKDGKSPGDSNYGKGRGYGPPRKQPPLHNSSRPPPGPPRRQGFDSDEQRKAFFASRGGGGGGSSGGSRYIESQGERIQRQQQARAQHFRDEQRRNEIAAHHGQIRNPHLVWEGRFTGRPVRQFLRDTYTPWNTAAPAWLNVGAQIGQLAAPIIPFAGHWRHLGTANAFAHASSSSIPLKSQSRNLSAFSRALSALNPFKSRTVGVASEISTAPFTASPRSILTRQYGSPESLNSALQHSRAYRARHPELKYLQDIGDSSLNQPVRANWSDQLLRQGDDAVYRTRGVNLQHPPEVTLGSHLTSDRERLLYSAAHEFRHVMQDTAGALSRQATNPRLSRWDYHSQPWEVEARLAEVRPILSRAAGQHIHTPSQVHRAIQSHGHHLDPDTLNLLYREGKPAYRLNWQKLGGLLGVPVTAPLTVHSLQNSSSRAIANQGSRPRRRQGFDSDEQRRAMFASMARGGGSGRGGGGSRGGGDNSDSRAMRPAPDWQPHNPSRWDRIREYTREGLKGFAHGLAGGTAQVLDTFTFGRVAPLSRMADSYQGSEFDVSRIAAQVGRDSLLTAVGVGAFQRLRAAYDMTRVGMALNSRHLSNPLMTVGGFGGQQLVEDYRASNPIRHYYSDKALAMGSQILGYVGAVGAFGTALRGLGAFARALPASGRQTADSLQRLNNSPFMAQMRANRPNLQPLQLMTKGGQRLSLATQTQRTIKAVDRALRGVGDRISTVIPASAKSALARAAAGQRWLSRFTGSTLKDLPRVGNVPAQLQHAAKAKRVAAGIRQTADAHRRQAEAITRDVLNVQNPILARLNQSHLAARLRDPGAQSIYRAARHDYYQTVKRGADQSRQTAQRMIDRAEDLTRRANMIDRVGAHNRRDAYENIARAVLVAGGIAGTEARDEYVIRKHYQDAYEALREGRDYRLAQDTARGPIGTFVQTMVGFNLNNPGEKQFRPGRERWRTATAAYRAGYDAINEDYRAGHITATHRDQMLHELADRGQPWNMQGRGVWTAAPAMAAFGEWKGRELIERARRSHIVRVNRVYDGDTVQYNHPRTGEPYSFPGQGPDQVVRGRPDDRSGWVRSLGYDTPELARTWGPPEDHRPAEWGGPESTERRKELQRPGQFTRVVQDSNARASGLGVFGRQLGYEETLPRPFDNLLRIPGLGRIIPARDVGEQMAREGHADVGTHYHLSGRTDGAQRLHDAMQHAIDNELGIFSPEGRLHHPDAGQSLSPAQRADQWFETQTGRVRPEETFWDKALTPAAIGLMTTGNTGIFRDLVRSGPGVSQLYNLTVAYLGAKNYNTRAERTSPRYAYQPAVRTYGDDEIAEILERARSRSN